MKGRILTSELWLPTTNVVRKNHVCQHRFQTIHTLRGLSEFLPCQECTQGAPEGWGRSVFGKSMLIREAFLEKKLLIRPKNIPATKESKELCNHIYSKSKENTNIYMRITFLNMYMTWLFFCGSKPTACFKPPHPQKTRLKFQWSRDPGGCWNNKQTLRISAQGRVFPEKKEQWSENSGYMCTKKPFLGIIFVTTDHIHHTSRTVSACLSASFILVFKMSSTFPGIFLQIYYSTCV